MGGFGSGRRFGCKMTTDQVKRIDIRYMRQQGLLKPGTQGELSWTCRGAPRGSIHYACSAYDLQLTYQYKEGDEWQPQEQRIAFEKTPCHFGGVRYWFRCPNCSKRVGLMYGRGATFLCRHCCQLGYASQQEGYTDNVLSQKHKLGERIFDRYEGGRGYGKKKGMHWKTYRRLHSKYEVLEQAWCKKMIEYLDGGAP